MSEEPTDSGTDFDAEFRAIMEEAMKDELPTDSQDDGSERAEDAQPDDAGEPSHDCRALILSPIDAPGALRAALDMVGSPAPVVGLGRSSGVFLNVDEDEGDSEEASMMALLGEDRPLPKSVDEMARLLSKLSKHGAVAIAAWTRHEPAADTDEDAAGELSGNIVARRYVNGEAEETLSSGLVLAGLNLVAEELLLGRIKPEEVDDYEDPGSWTGWLKGRGRR